MTSFKDLWAAWYKVVQCMEEHGESVFNSNEEATRYALVNPILKSLGWDVENPQYVRVEFHQEDGKKPDYTCLRKGKPVMYVEAKKWGTFGSIKKPDDLFLCKEFTQLRDYCHANSVRVGVLSDGGGWYALDFPKRGHAKLIAFVDAEKAGEPEVKKLLSISRDALSERFP